MIASILDALARVRELMPARLRGRYHAMLAIMIVHALVDASGVLSVYPLLATAADPGLIQRNRWLKAVYDGLGFQSEATFVVCMGFFFLTVFLLTNVSAATVEWVRTRFAAQLNHAMLMQLLGRYLRSPYAWFLAHPVATLSQRVLADVPAVTHEVVMRLSEVIARLVVAIAICLVLLVINPVVAVITTLALGVLFSWIYRFFKLRLADYSARRVGSWDQVWREVGTALSSLKEARAFSEREAFYQRVEPLSREISDLFVRERMVGRLPRYFTEMLAVTAIVGVLIFLVGRGQGNAAVPLVGLYIMATWRLVPNLQDVYSESVEVRTYLPILQRVHLQLTQPMEQLPDDLAGPLPLRQEVRLREVRFGYGPEEVIRGVSLRVPRNSSLALVGRTGAGKTTLADLLGGYLTPTEGLVEVDGQPLTPERVLAWQRNIGYVPQDVYLLDDNVWRNVSLREDPDREAVRRACELANISEFIEAQLAQGYDTNLGDRGITLSGGQKQRIALARALYNDPEVLILDEATSSLDNQTEVSVMDALGGLSGRKTLLIIAHRLSTVKRCDQICMLEDGRIVAQGTYAELLESSAPFQALAAAG